MQYLIDPDGRSVAVYDEKTYDELRARGYSVAPPDHAPESQDAQIFAPAVRGFGAGGDADPDPVMDPTLHDLVEFVTNFGG